MPIAYAQVDSAYKIYRGFKDKSEDDWDGDVFLDRTLVDGETSHDDEPTTPPPYIVLVQGPPKVGKSLLIKSVVKYFTREHQNDIPPLSSGPITVIIDNTRRLQFIECPDDINGMIDAAKYADLVLLLIDASYGFEAETFEFVNLLQAHSFPPVIGVLTHLDEIKDNKKADETIHRLMFHFQTEICQGASIYCVSGPYHDLYETGEVQKLAEDISKLHFRSSLAHPYVLVDRLEDVTSPETMQKDGNCNRNISLYGYLRGCSIKSGAKVHLAGVGDFHLAGVRSITDPFPFSSEMETGNNFVEPTHMDNEIFRTGTYLRLEVHGVPFQVVENFNPCHPILVGGISPEEENEGYMQVRLKRHNWHIKLLKSADPVTVSAGWRRYQTKPVFATEIDNGGHEFATYIPEYKYCVAMFWGPLAPPSTRIAVVQGNKGAFRITAKAVVLDPKQDFKIMKKRKLKGNLHKIRERTAFMKFTLDTDVAKLIGGPIWTRTGILGMVNEVAERGGMAECIFEKKIRKSDCVFMHVLRQVEAPRFVSPLSDCTLPVNEDLLKQDDPAQTWLRLIQRRAVEIIDGGLAMDSAENTVSEGTTCITVKSNPETFVAFDSMTKKTLSSEVKKWYANNDMRAPSRICNLKAFQIAGHLYVSRAGSTGWTMPLIEKLGNMVPTVGLGLTPERCAQEASATFNNQKHKSPLKGPGGFDIQSRPASICISSFRQVGVPSKTICVRRNGKGDVSCRRVLTKAEAENYTVPFDELHYKEPFKTFCCQGSGGKYAYSVLQESRHIFEKDTFENDDRKKVHQQKVLAAVLKAMAWACIKDPESTGGFITVVLLTEHGYKILYQDSAENLVRSHEEWLDKWKLYWRMTERVKLRGMGLMNRNWSMESGAPGGKSYYGASRPSITTSSNNEIGDGYGTPGGSAYCGASKPSTTTSNQEKDLESKDSTKELPEYLKQRLKARGILKADTGKGSVVASPSKLDIQPNQATAVTRLPPGWVEAKDPASGSSYYYHESTRKTQWEIPSENFGSAQPPYLPPQQDWIEMWDQSTGCKFYFNTQTHVTQWEVPKSLMEVEASQKVPLQHDKEEGPPFKQIKCMGCGRLGLVQASGYCNQCTRVYQQYIANLDSQHPFNNTANNREDNWPSSKPLVDNSKKSFNQKRKQTEDDELISKRRR